MKIEQPYDVRGKLDSQFTQTLGSFECLAMRHWKIRPQLTQEINAPKCLCPKFDREPTEKPNRMVKQPYFVSIHHQYDTNNGIPCQPEDY